MAKFAPSVVVLAGPNGAGKSTAAPALLRGTLQVTEFVNADDIARGLSAFEPEKVAVSAGKIMISRLRELAEKQASFAFETTLASRMFAPWLRDLKEQGYQFHLVFVWLPSADMAVARVSQRVLGGGHSVPAQTIHRRYRAGLLNFKNLYQPVADSWQVYDGSVPHHALLVARGVKDCVVEVASQIAWRQFQQQTADFP